jgi:glycosyltransferase involved in cell wall biosynthesis
MADWMFSLVIPAYNEELRIIPVLQHILMAAPVFEIIIVCDGPDNTGNLVREIAADHPEIVLIERPERLGKGDAICEGFRLARGEIVGFMDCDESIDITEMINMVQALGPHDGVIASRRMDRSKIVKNQPFQRRLVSSLFNILFVRFLFRLPYSDTQCGAKIFRKNVILPVIPEIRSTGFEMDLELLWRLQRDGCDIIEYPVTWKHAEGSKFRLRYSLEMFWNLMIIRFDLPLKPCVR